MNKTITLQDIAHVRSTGLYLKKNEHPTITHSERECNYITWKDIPKAGFISTTIETRIAHYSPLDMERLRQNDIILSIQGRIGEVAIIGDTNTIFVTSKMFALIRMSTIDDAMALYMYLKSNSGQESIMDISSSRVQKNSSHVIKYLTINSIKSLSIPSFTQDDKTILVNKFYKEINLYSKISDIEKEIDTLKKGDFFV